jgi:FLVCR family feline leukemia virus subgroup C receptor-related protein
MIIVAREKPPTPPSISAERKPEKLKFRSELKGLLRNKSYLLLVVCYATLYGTVTTVGAVIASLTKPYEYTSSQNSLFGGVFIISGIFGSITVGIILDKFHKFKKVLMVISFTAVLFMSLVLVTLPSKNVPLFTINLVLLGFGAVPLTALSFAFSVELTYPTPEAVSNGMMLVPSKIYSSLLSVIAGIVAKKSPLYAVLIFIGNAVICSICSIFI